MIQGLLWYDNSAACLADKVERGAAHYQTRHGQRPTRCYVHPSMLLAAGAFPNIPGLYIKGDNTVQPNYFWFGLSKEPEAA